MYEKDQKCMVAYKSNQTWYSLPLWLPKTKNKRLNKTHTKPNPPKKNHPSTEQPKSKVNIYTKCASSKSKTNKDTNKKARTTTATTKQLLEYALGEYHLQQESTGGILFSRCITNCRQLRVKIDRKFCEKNSI